MATDTEQLVVQLEARINDFEKSFQRASKTANDNWSKIEQRGKQAGDRMSSSVKAATQEIANGFEALRSPVQGASTLINALIGASVVAGVAGIATSFGDLINKLSDFGDRAQDLRLPANFIQSLSVAADEARLSQDKLNSALDTFTDVSKKNIDDASDFYRALRNVGTGFETAFKNATSQEARLRIISNALHSTTDEVKQAQLLMTAFGTDSAAAMRLFGQGASAFDDAREKIRALGLEIDESAIQRAQQAKTQLSLLARVVGDELSTSFAGLIPTFRNLLPYLEKIAGVARDVLAIFAHTDAEKPIGTLQNEVATLDKQLDDLQALRDRMANNKPSEMDTIRDQLRGMLGKFGFDLSENLADVDKQIGEVKKRRDQVVDLLKERAKASANPPPPAFKPRPSLSDKDNDDSSSFDRTADSINRHAASLRADAAALGLSNAAHESLRAELQLLQAAQRDDEGVTNAQIDRYAELRRTMSAQQALTASGITLNKEHAETFGEVSGRVGTAAQQLESYKTRFQGVNDALRCSGDQLVDVLDRASQRGANMGQIMQDVLRNLERQLLQAAITGEGAFGKMFGLSSSTGGVGGLFGFIGKALGFADGGYVQGPGSSTSDSIPANLSNGEFVINASATKRYRSLLEAINAGKVAKFANGGAVGRNAPRSAPIQLAPSVTQNLAVHVNGSAGTPDQNRDLADRIAKSIEPMARGMVGKEIRTQMRPGGLLSR
jgi:hypothetical protein